MRIKGLPLLMIGYGTAAVAAGIGAALGLGYLAVFSIVWIGGAVVVLTILAAQSAAAVSHIADRKANPDRLAAEMPGTGLPVSFLSQADAKARSRSRAKPSRRSFSRRERCTDFPARSS